MGRRLRFRGESRHKVDTKGRVSIPASFRRVLQAGDPDWSEGHHPNFVIVYGDSRRKFLECYTIEEIERVEDKISSMDHSPERRLAERTFLTQSITTTVDDTGRIVLPAKLREKISLGKEAQFAGVADTFQIWEPSAYEAEIAATDDYLGELDDDFDPSMLLDKVLKDRGA